ncbi:MAG TPA: hypothetical protein VF334_04025 [Polyangia bacterium]
MTARALAVALVVAAAAPAHAYDVAVNTGFVEVIGLPERQHIGFYPYLGVSLAFPLRRVTLVPELTVEASPDSARWGFVATLVADFQVQRRLGLDLDVTLLHDQPGGDFGAAEFLLGAGVGFSVFVGTWTISPYVNVFRDLSVAGWALVPGLNLAKTIE